MRRARGNIKYHRVPLADLRRVALDTAPQHLFAKIILQRFGAPLGVRGRPL